jgi:hypothetical protein
VQGRYLENKSSGEVDADDVTRNWKQFVEFSRPLAAPDEKRERRQSEHALRAGLLKHEKFDQATHESWHYFCLKLTKSALFNEQFVFGFC